MFVGIYRGIIIPGFLDGAGFRPSTVVRLVLEWPMCWNLVHFAGSDACLPGQPAGVVSGVCFGQPSASPLEKTLGENAVRTHCPGTPSPKCALQICAVTLQLPPPHPNTHPPCLAILGNIWLVGLDQIRFLSWIGS